MQTGLIDENGRKVKPQLAETYEDPEIESQSPSLQK